MKETLMIEAIMDTIHELSFINIRDKHATTEIQVSDLEILRRHILQLKLENYKLKKTNESQISRLDTLRSNLTDLNMKMLCQHTAPKFDAYKQSHIRGKYFDQDC
jgi:hypothetical protein